MACQASQTLTVANLGKRCFSGVKNPCFPLEGSDGLCSERKWVREPLHGIFSTVRHGHSSLSSPFGAHQQQQLTGRHTCVSISVQAPGMKGWGWPTPAGHFLQGNLELWLWWQMLVQMDSCFSSIWFFPRYLELILASSKSTDKNILCSFMPQRIKKKNKSITKIM